MFKKVPYGVKVRVRGNEQDGFIAEYAICCTRFMPFLDNWGLISHYTHTPYTKQDTFPTFELAKEAAMKQYDSWIGFYKRDEETKRIAKAQRKVVWKHP
jgi:hypothetical protein